MDISDPENPEEISFLYTPEIARGVAISGNYLYLADTYSLRVVDVSDPFEPVEVGFYDLPGATFSLALWGGDAYVAGTNGGLYILHYRAELALEKIYLPLVGVAP
jgi:hypothetical protein